MRVAAPVGASERMLARIVPRGPRRDRRPGVGPFCEGAPAEYDSGCDSAEYDGEDERPGAAGSRLLRLAQSTEGIAHGHRLVRPGRSGLRRRRHGRRTDAPFVPDRSQRSEVSAHAEAFVRESLTPARHGTLGLNLGRWADAAEPMRAGGWCPRGADAPLPGRARPRTPDRRLRGPAREPGTGSDRRRGRGSHRGR